MRRLILCLGLFAILAQRSLSAEITVAAASSLTQAFKEISAAYRTANKGDQVNLTFGASGALLQQVSAGAPVDVFALADVETMLQAEKAQLVGSGGVTIFAENRLVLIVPISDQIEMNTISDLGQKRFDRIAIGNPSSVPAGRYARQALDTLRLWSAFEPKFIYTQNVLQAFDYVARGEAEAGFVYATDAAMARDKVRVALEIPTDVKVRYPIAILKESKEPAAAERFVKFVLSDAGRAILLKHGFRLP